MKKSILLSFVISIAINNTSAYAQWLERDTNTTGNWLFNTSNNGTLFNRENVAGAIWPRNTTQRLIFGGGLWLGGKVITFIDRMTKAVTIGYNPNTAMSEFCSGSSIYDGTYADSSATAVEKYRVYRSTEVPTNEWPIRLVNKKPSYIDDVSLRSSAGPPAYIGDEDMFIVYKNTDTSFFAPWHFGQPIPHFEIRTTLSSWKKGLGADVILVKNEIIYLDTNILYNPAVAFAVDPDLPTEENDNLELGFITNDISGCMIYAHDSKLLPILAVYLMKGFTTSHHSDPGITTLHRWTIANDPPTRELQYDFMTDGTKDTTNTGIVADLRLLLASAQSEPLLKGDTIHFDYALFAFMPALNNDSISLKKTIDEGMRLKDLYNKDSLGLLAVKTESRYGNKDVIALYPNPAYDKCNVRTNEPIVSIRLYDVIGKEVTLPSPIPLEENETEISLAGIMSGIYFLHVNSHVISKIVVQ